MRKQQEYCRERQRVEEERYNYKKNLETEEEAARIVQREVESRGREIQL